MNKVDMSVSKTRRTATVVVLAAEISHVFCCGIPMLVAVLSAGTQIGLGGGFLVIHEMLHAFEIPIFFGSGILLVLGLGLHYFSFWLDCRETGCEHADCTPKKFRVGRIFVLAVILYAANVTFYVLSSHGL